MSAAPAFGSLFSGIGGFDLGLERAGWRCAFQVEIDPFCTKVLERHWPHVRRHRDIRDVAFAPPAGQQLPVGAASPDRESVDLLCGGFPCQDLSVAGRRAGIAGARSGLFFEFVRLARELRPAWLLLENVPGLLSSNGGRDFAVVLAALGDAGYGVGWRVLDSRWFGVPQRRRRVFLVGRLGGPCPAAVLVESEGVRGDPAPRGEAGTGASADAGVRFAGRLGDVTHALRRPSRGAAWRGDGQDDLVVASETGQGWWLEGEPALRAQPGGTPANVAYALTAPGGKGGDPTMDTYVASHDISPPLMGEGHDASEDGRGRKAFVVNGNSTPEVGDDLALPLRNNDGSGNRQALAFAWQQGDDSPHTGTGRGRSWVARAGDYTGALSTTRHDAVAFNHIQDPASSPSVAPTLGEEGQAVAYSLHADALGRSGEATTPSADAEGRVRLRDPGLGVITGESYSLTATAPHAVAAPLTSGGHPNSNAPGRRKEDDINLVAAVGEGAHGVQLTDDTYSLAGNGGKPGQGYAAALQGSAVRRLTPTECSRLQAFPDSWTCLCGVEPYSTWDCKCPDGPRYAALGNAVTVNVIEWLGRRLLTTHQGDAA